MSKRIARKYKSDVRSKQSEQTRKKILSAARSLFRDGGYEETAIDAIARKAGVSSPTVYAVFGSKIEILKQLLDSARFGQRYQDAVHKVLSSSNPKLRLRLVSKVARSVYDGERAELGHFRSAGMLSPEIATLEKEGESRRYESQKPVIDLLVRNGALRKGISEKRARDILWCLTGRDIYRMLVAEKGWTSDEYEQWLGELLVRALL